MRLRKKAAFILAIAWCALMLMIYIGTSTVVMRSYLEVEHNQVSNKMLDVENTLHRLVDEVETFTTDTAVWNDTYKFIEEKDQKAFNEYVTANLQITVLAASYLDLALYYNTKEEKIFARASNYERTAEVPLPDGLDAYFYPGSVLTRIGDPKGIKGFILLPIGIYMAAAHPILKTDYSGPARGMLIFARLFSNETLKNMSDMTHVNLSIYYLNRQLPANIEAVRQTLLNEPTFHVKFVNNKLLYAYILLRDINKKPIAILQADIPRSTYLAGLATFRSLNVIFLVFGVVFTILMVYLLNLFVLKRLEAINKQLSLIEEKGDFSLRVEESGSDEVASLEKETNKTLTIIKEYSDKQNALLDEVSFELNNAKLIQGKLEEAEKLLKEITNTMNASLIIVDKNLIISHLNIAALLLQKVKLQDVIGKSIFEVFPYLSAFKELFAESAQHKTAKFIERVIDTQNNYYFSGVIYPVYLQSVDQGFAVILDDVTESIKLRETVQENDRFTSIGILTAGIAHEINNPVNFIKSSVNSIQRNLKDIFSVIFKYQSTAKESEPLDTAMNDINEYKTSIDLTYTIDETQRLLKGINEGASRTSSIVSGLTEFSQMNVQKMTKFDIHDGLDSTIILLSEKLKNKINVIKHYGHIPLVECIPGKINQVFMNVLSNAIDAILDKGDIEITTKSEGNNVVITIKDNGAGMDEITKAKIYEPFFTTKEVGSGQGLGLSITFGIIADHHGQIEVKSELGKGTEFIITLPVAQTMDGQGGLV